MRVKFLSPALSLLLINLVCAASAPAKGSAEKDAQFAARVRSAIVKIDTGPSARVELKLRDGTKVKGYVSEARDASFVVVDDKSGIARDVAYPQVKQVKGHNLSTGASIAIGIGIGFALMLLVIAVANGDG